MTSNRHVAAFWFLTWIVTALLCAIGVHFATASQVPDAGSVVRIQFDSGSHGSGVHIGDGFIITAAHVVMRETGTAVIDSSGKNRGGEILWANGAYDLALVHVADAAGLAVSELSCDTPTDVGTFIEAVGDPLDMGAVRTRGYVASTVAKRADWTSAFVADITLAPGMSGGPAFDASGRIIGIVVGGAVALRSIVALSFIVPSATVCHLMGRAS